MSITPDVQVDGPMWILVAREGEKNLVAYGRTLSIAVKNMEFKYKVTVSLPGRFGAFAEATADEYAKTTAEHSAE